MCGVQGVRDVGARRLIVRLNQRSYPLLFARQSSISPAFTDEREFLYLTLFCAPSLSPPSGLEDTQKFNKYG